MPVLGSRDQDRLDVFIGQQILVVAVSLRMRAGTFEASETPFSRFGS